MFERSVIYLISQSPNPRGVTETATETEHMVYVTVKSVGHTEVYEALTHGLHPTLTFYLANYLDYDGELYLLYNSKPYRVIRTYRVNMGLEITVEEAPNV